MAAKSYYGNDMSLTVKTEAGTSLTVGVLKDVEIVPGVEVDELYGADSTKRQTAKQREFSVNVSVGVAQYDVTMIQEWLGGSGSSSTGFVDTTDLALFEITGQVTPTGGGTDLKGVVEEVYFPEMPVFSATEGEYVTEELEGTGKAITVTGP
jgi:hypothetical protein